MMYYTNQLMINLILDDFVSPEASPSESPRPACSATSPGPGLHGAHRADGLLAAGLAPGGVQHQRHRPGWGSWGILGPWGMGRRPW